MQVLSVPSVFEVVESWKIPAFFSRYPAAINVGARDVENALNCIDEQACEVGSRESRRARVRHSNPYGDVFSICHCSAFPDRLVLAASIIEVLWIHDDIIEELEHQTACREHAVLAEVLRIDIDPSIFEPQNVRQKTLAFVLRKAIDIDPAQAPAMIETLKRYLDTYDDRGDDFARMEDYAPCRIRNSGYSMASYFICWGMGIILSDEDQESIREYDSTMGNVFGLTNNDYFSWSVEKDQQTDRVRNGVRVLMKEHNIPADIAKTLLLGVIIEQESKGAKLKEERLKKPVSEQVLRYFEAIELYVGGSCFWHATAPRYQGSNDTHKHSKCR